MASQDDTFGRSVLLLFFIVVVPVVIYISSSENNPDPVRCERFIDFTMFNLDEESQEAIELIRKHTSTCDLANTILGWGKNWTSGQSSEEFFLPRITRLRQFYQNKFTHEFFQ